MLQIKRTKSNRRQWKAFLPTQKGALWIHEKKNSSVFRIDASGLFYTNLIMNCLNRMHDKWNPNDNPSFFVTKEEINRILQCDFQEVM